MLDYPVRSFVNFCDNHGLLKLYGRPQWRTVENGSASYVSRVMRDINEAGGTVETDIPVERILRSNDQSTVVCGDGQNIRGE